MITNKSYYFSEAYDVGSFTKIISCYSALEELLVFYVVDSVISGKWYWGYICPY